MTIGTGKIGVLRINMDKVQPRSTHIVQGGIVALRKDEVAGLTVSRLDRHLSLGGGVVSVVAAEASIPVFVANIVGMGSPIEFDLREEISGVDLLSDLYDWR